jgi:hypothetical protein
VAAEKSPSDFFAPSVYVVYHTEEDPEDNYYTVHDEMPDFEVNKLAAKYQLVSKGEVKVTRTFEPYEEARQ